MYFRKKHATHHKHDAGRIFAWLALTTGLGNAAFWTIFPLVVDVAVGSAERVSIFFAFLSICSLIWSITTTVILERVRRSLIAKTTLAACSLLLFCFIFANQFHIITLIAIPYSFAMLLIGIILSLYVRDFAATKRLGFAEGRYYLFSNIGWFIGPLAGGLIAEYASRSSVFLLSALAYLVSLIIFTHQHLKGHKHLQDTNEKHHIPIGELLDNVKRFFTQKELRKVFAVAFGLNYWWSISSIYIPIFIIFNGFSELVVGLVLSGGFLPLVLLEKRVGSLTDAHGLRCYLVLGFAILAIVTILFEFVTWLPAVLILMALVNIGAAFIEPLQETYLFTQVSKKNEEKYFGVYNIAEPVSGVIAPLIGAVLIAIGGFAALWYGTAAIMVFFSLNALRTNV